MNNKVNQMDIADMTDDQMKTELIAPHLGKIGKGQLEIDATHEELVAAVTHARRKQAA